MNSLELPKEHYTETLSKGKNYPTTIFLISPLT